MSRKKKPRKSKRLKHHAPSRNDTERLLTTKRESSTLLPSISEEEGEATLKFDHGHVDEDVTRSPNININIGANSSTGGPTSTGHLLLHLADKFRHLIDIKVLYLFFLTFLFFVFDQVSFDLKALGKFAGFYLIGLTVLRIADTFFKKPYK